MDQSHIQSKFLKILAYNVKYLRKSKGMTQEELAKLSGVSVRTFQQIESGECNPTLSTIELLAKTLDVNFSNLIRLEKLSINCTPEKFLEIFSSQFENYHLPLGIRNIEGMTVWANQLIRDMNPHIKKWPINVFEIYKDRPDILNQLQATLNAEKQGIVLQNNLQRIGNTDGKITFYRVASILVYLKKNSMHNFTIVFSTEMNSKFDCEFNEFSNRLIKAYE